MFERCNSYEDLADEIKVQIRRMNSDARLCKVRLGLLDEAPDDARACGYKSGVVPDEVIEEHVKFLRSCR